MTKSSPAPTDHWAVSARASGGIVTAGVTLPSIELSLLGIPPGFTESEIQTWLRDLAGVAIETSRSDQRQRPIPPLLHHALTGLLFSQTELWSHTGHPLPFAAVFVHGPHGVAFGWVGRARAVLLVNGEPHEPQWVIVRDESGQEALSASLPADAHVLLTLEYWPRGETNSPAPASIDAEFGQPFADAASSNLALEGDEETDLEPIREAHVSRTPDEEIDEIEEELDELPPARATSPGAPFTSPGTPAKPAPSGAHAKPTPSGTPAALPTQQPGLAPDPTGIRFADTEASQTLPSTRHPSSGTFAMPQVPKSAPTEPAKAEPAARRAEPQSQEPAGEPGHPVGRWLQKLMGFARKREEAQESTPPPPRPARIEKPAAPAAPALKRPTLEPQPAQRVDASDLEPAPLPARDIDIREPHALPTEAGRMSAVPGPPQAPNRPWSLNPAVSASGLAAAGMSEILGALKPAAQPAAPRPVAAATNPPAGPVPPNPKRMEGLTARSSGGSVPGPAQRPPYPVLELKPGSPPGRGPIHIDHEPVGADTTFAIPKLPPRGAPPASQPPPPVRAPQPPAAATQRPAASAPPPPPPQPAAPPPARRDSELPEPPTEFLERFAASMRVAPSLEPTPPENVAPPRELPPATGGHLPPSNAPVPGAQAGAPGPQRTAGPPALPSARRAAAQTQRPIIPPPPADEPARPLAGQGAPEPPLQRRPLIPSLTPEAATPMSSTPAPTPVLKPVTTPVLRSPSESAPVPVVESEMSTMLRELPLTPGEKLQPGEIPDGMLVAQPASGRPRPRPSRRGEWPDLDELEKGPAPLWRRPWFVIMFVTVMLGIGWILGHSQAPDNDVHATPMTRLLRTVGFGGARFTASIDTDPPGAWIAIDGKDLGRRTPSTLELLPGDHALTLSMPDLGEVKVDLKGKRGQKVKVNEVLHGSLDVVASDPSLPVQMSLDGAPQGYLPVHVAKLPPGLHELQFNGPKMQPWAQQVNIGIRKNTKVVSKPMMSPATGVVQVLAQMNDENGSAPLPGASVYVDGVLGGTTPATIELPRGPHSLRVQFEGVVAPIQVIDLPGGNKRFATFQFGLDSDLPPLKLEAGTQKLLAKDPAVVSASLDGLEADDLREAWLHVLTPDGLWSRFPMTINAGDRGAVLTVSFPVSQFGGEAKATWYLSAATKQGDEFFTEVQHSTR